MTALRALLAGIVDYAGLFPPAGLDMPAAVRNYASYRTDDHAWMLGRFVVPVSRLGEFDAALAQRGGGGRGGGGDEPEWRLSALIGGDVAAELDAVRAYNASRTGVASIDSVEVKLSTVDAVELASAACLNDSFAVFAELPIEGDPQPLVEAVKRRGMAAKVRTGGVTAAAIPATALVVRFLRRCIEADVRFKATAGLHHPLRAAFPLTYEPGAPVGPMFGYLNLFLAAGFMAHGMTDDEAAALLEESDARSLDVGSSAIAWRGHRITAQQLRQVRGQVAVSFGSCSFREPVDELKTLIIA